ncbi:RNA polymerase sigma-70 factor (ECF subfamily) [Anseongella ginsenosidimutans]|uniref:RNA polymerase sigma-70 factor (ECF subfamily) n=1 Tax=Anseongella ginsenosidimutans TaxID=496056 RepID=A0A4R3KY70_9SPHI|nr:RNA polymerase sigma-70 factor [Anseongella ginsenosidimutans]TCS90234.1 RNA polymerase sigma-70 factor (ECF subfamily) [Anseongella ginsenosidimutans]
MSLQALSDKELIDLLKEDHEKTFEEIYNRYWLKLLKIAYQKTGHREAAEEIVQDLFIKLWERRMELEIRRSLESYLFIAVKYRVINFVHSQTTIIQQENSRLPSVTWENQTEEQLNYREMNEQLRQAVRKLPEKSRIVFELSRYKYYSNKHIADKLNISEKAVEYHITRSLKLLRSQLKDSVILIALLILL